MCACGVAWHAALVVKLLSCLYFKASWVSSMKTPSSTHCQQSPGGFKNGGRREECQRTLQKQPGSRFLARDEISSSLHLYYKQAHTAPTYTTLGADPPTCHRQVLTQPCNKDVPVGTGMVARLLRVVHSNRSVFLNAENSLLPMPRTFAPTLSSVPPTHHTHTQKTSDTAEALPWIRTRRVRRAAATTCRRRTRARWPWRRRMGCACPGGSGHRLALRSRASSSPWQACKY